MSDERISANLSAVTPSMANAEWHLIVAGIETGPMSIERIVGKARAGEIESDDLVKQSGGPWIKVGEVRFLKELLLSAYGESALPDLASFKGVWISKNVLVCLLLVVFSVSATLLVIRRSIQSMPPLPDHDVKAPFLPNVHEAKAPVLPDPPKREAKSPPKAPHFYLQRGNDWIDRQDYDQAILAYEEAIRLDAGDALANITPATNILPRSPSDSPRGMLP